MGFLQSIVVALVLAVTSLTTTTFAFFYVAQSPTAKVFPAASSTTTTSNNRVPPISSPSSTATTPASSSANNSVPSTSSVYNGVGYSLDIPSNLIYVEFVDNQKVWRSKNYDEIITVQWGPNSPNSEITGLYEANTHLANTQPPVVLSHPSMKGATEPGTLIEKPLPPPFSYGEYLYVNGTNGNIYFIYGLSNSPTARASVQKIVASFTLTDF